MDLNEGAQLARIAALQAEGDELQRELEAELEVADKALVRVTAAFEAGAYTLVHFSTQPEPFLTQNPPWTPANVP